MQEILQTICQITGAIGCQPGEVVQSLWSGYGVIQRVQLEFADQRGSSTAIVKHIDLSQSRENRRGWSGNASHQRKVRSYQVEKNFYERFAAECWPDKHGDEFGESLVACRVPKLLGACELNVRENEESSGMLLILEDLNAVGFAQTKVSASPADLRTCLQWLANFHARFMNRQPTGLWPIGTYWHLATRLEEHSVMEESRLKRCAAKIDQRLNSARFQTLVHGDAKLANFCFGQEPVVAAVDFQYVGRGCGVKDVAYLMSSCLDGSESAAQQNELLAIYFRQLEHSLSVTNPKIDFPELESEWRSLYPFAWADFCRFLAGWSPGHWKMNQYNDRVTQSVLDELTQ